MESKLNIASYINHYNLLLTRHLHEIVYSDSRATQFECEVPAPLGNGSNIFMKLEEGLFIIKANSSHMYTTCIDFHHILKSRHFLLFFNLGTTSGIFRIKQQGAGIYRPLHSSNEVHNNKFSFLFPANIHLKFSFPVKSAYAALFIIFSKDWLLTQSDKDLLKELNILLDTDLSISYPYLRRDISGQELSMAFDIMKSNTLLQAGRIDMKANIMKLVSSKIIQILSNKEQEIKIITESELERIIKTKELLLNDLDDRPPTISALARHAAMGTTKFKILFKLIFGTSCYQYYQKARIQVARELLDSGKYTVTEVAFKVGYHNLGYFSKVFRTHFKVMPSEYILRRSRSSVPVLKLQASSGTPRNQ